MLKFWKMFRYVAMGGIVLQFGGCPVLNGLFSNLLNNGVSFLALEFLTDNAGIFDLFQDS